MAKPDAAARPSYLWYWPNGGWDFDRWREEYGSASMPEEGQRTLLSGESWAEERADLERRLDSLLGTLNDRPPADGPQPQFLGPTLTRSGEERAAYTMRRLRYALTDEEWGYAWLLVPFREGEDASPRPAVIALHPTAQQGKAVSVGLEADVPDGDPDERGREYGSELAAQGFVVLVPDAIAFGERTAEHPNAFYRSADAFYSRHPQGSVMAKMSFDVSRAVDLLQSLPGVDPERIGCIGHSHGGYGTLFAMLADPRLRAGVVSCGLSPFRTDPGVDRWWRRTALIPRLGLYEGRMESTPLDLEHLLALAAPRPLLIAAALADACFPELESMQSVIADARRVYALHGATDQLQECLYEGAHCFPPHARAAGYALLRDTLFCGGEGKVESARA